MLVKNGKEEARLSVKNAQATHGGGEAKGQNCGKKMEMGPKEDLKSKS